MSAIGKIFAPGGELSQALPAYEVREQQVQVSEAIHDRMKNGGVVIAEAATGCGKSIAYLVPAGFEAARKRRTLVATATIALQDQITRKDLPLLTSLPSFQNLKFALAKGASNYACKVRAHEVADEDSTSLIEGEGKRDGQAMLAFALESETGDREDFPPDIGNFSDIAVDLDACTKSKCEFYDSCHYMRARGELASADIIVSNFHLLMADLSLRQLTGGEVSLLGEYDHVVIDEAHNLRDIATDTLGVDLSQFAISQLLGRLKGQKKGAGAIPRYIASVAKGTAECSPDTEAARALLQEAEEDVYPAIADVLPAAKDFFVFVEAVIKSMDEKDPKVEIVEILKGSFAEQFKVDAGKLAARLRDLAATVRKWLPSEDDPPRREVEAQIDRLRDMARTLETFTGEMGPNDCAWAELTGPPNARRVKLRSAPIDVSVLLRPMLFEATRLRSVTLTSATLSTNGKLDLIARQLGIDKPKEIIVESPFDFEANCRLIVPVDFVSPKDKRFDLEAAKACARIAGITKGRTLMLFTSYTSMNLAERVIRQELAKEIRSREVSLLVQGQGVSKRQMVDEMRKHRNVILLGAASFWEGVDLPGDLLSTVVINKLPFGVPSEPVEKARVRAVEETLGRGKAFMELSVPEATIKLKQGFGRLIRTATDRGVVVLLDNRLTSTGYGKRILKSLPPAFRCFGYTETCLQPQWFEF